jgi:hypothetical protein
MLRNEKNIIKVGRAITLWKAMQKRRYNPT